MHDTARRICFEEAHPKITRYAKDKETQKWKKECTKSTIVFGANDTDRYTDSPLLFTSTRTLESKYSRPSLDVIKNATDTQ